MMQTVIWKGPAGDVPRLGRCWHGREMAVSEELAEILLAQKLVRKVPEQRGDSTKRRSKGD